MNTSMDMEGYRMRRDMFDGNETATKIKVIGLSRGSIDPYTEEIISPAFSWTPISGILGTIQEQDELLGLIGGRLKIGDTMVTYHYDTISGVFLQQDIEDIEISATGVSGLYHVESYKVNSVAGKPMFLKVGLKLDSND